MPPAQSTPKVTFNRVVNISMDRGTTVSLGSPFHHPQNKCFLLFKWNSLHFGFVPVTSCPVMGCQIPFSIMEKSFLASKGNTASDLGRLGGMNTIQKLLCDQTDPPSSVRAFVDLQKSMAAPLNPLVLSLQIQITKLFLFHFFAFHILQPFWDDVKPEHMENSMQRGAVELCSELVRKIDDLTSVEW